MNINFPAPDTEFGKMLDIDYLRDWITNNFDRIAKLSAIGDGYEYFKQDGVVCVILMCRTDDNGVVLTSHTKDGVEILWTLVQGDKPVVHDHYIGIEPIE